MATVNDPEMIPAEIEHVEELTGLPDNPQPVSDEEKPEPETSTTAPTEAEVVLRLTVGAPPWIVKLADAESAPGDPVAVIVYVPALSDATVKLPVNVPPETEQVKELIGVPEMVQEESLVKKSKPVTSTVVPGNEEAGFSVIDGGTEVTTKLAEAESPIGSPVAVTW